MEAGITMKEKNGIESPGERRRSPIHANERNPVGRMRILATKHSIQARLIKVQIPPTMTKHIAPKIAIGICTNHVLEVFSASYAMSIIACIPVNVIIELVTPKSITAPIIIRTPANILISIVHHQG